MKHCWAKVLFWGVVAVLGVSAMLAGCGQKGPLYLPDDHGKQRSEQSER